MSGWPRSFLKASLFSAPLFVIPILLLLLNRLGVVDLGSELAYERTIIANLVLYWLIAAAAVTAWLERRALVRSLAANRPQVVLLVVTLMVALVAAELLLRTLDSDFGPGRFRMISSPVFHHLNAPNQVGYGMGDVVVETNEDGFRSPYSREEFLRYSERIVVLGDSFAFGLGVEGDATASSVLERALRSSSAGGDVAVINAGATSYSPLLERTLFSRVARHYQPTLTLLLLDLSDIGDDMRYAEENRSNDPGAPDYDLPAERPGPSRLEAFALWRALAPIRWRLALPFEHLREVLQIEEAGYDYYDFQLEVGGVVETNRFFVLRHPLELTAPYFEATLANVGAIAAEARSIGSEFWLVVTPRHFHWSSDECPDNWERLERGYYNDDEPYEYEYLRFFEEARDRVDFPILSLLPDFERADEFPLVFRHDPHWNAAGHRVVGRALAGYVTRGLEVSSGDETGGRP